MRIKVLDDQVINQIAAGEVVERPVAVIRELVENSIDAGAKSIDVYLENGGKTLLRVADDGFGMDKADALLSFERHATSKISSAADLKAISSLGFRGEALAAISAVSNLTMKTRIAESSAGTLLQLHAGKLHNVSAVACSAGTVIEVQNLFINTPARKKFLKSDDTEERKIKDWLKNTALAHPLINFKLSNDKRELLNFRSVGSSLDRAKNVFPETSVLIENETARCRIKGLLAHPSMAQASGSGLSIIVNGRVISDRLLLKAIKDGFSTTLKYQEFPVGFVDLELPPEDLDVNVHPQKSEVRFVSPQHIYILLRDSVSAAVQNFKTPVSNFTDYKSSFAPRIDGMTDSEVSYLPAQSDTSGSTSAYSATQAALSFFVSDNPVSFKFSQLKYIGQMLDCYLVCEYADNFVLVDMHAAHERYNFNLVRNSFKSKLLKSQIYLIPKAIELNEEGLENCLSQQSFLEKFGFEIERFGNTTLLVRSVPALLSHSDISALIKEIAAFDFQGNSESSINKALDYVAARVACHASLRSGDLINKEQAQALFIALDSSEFSAACPHGRPIVVEFSLKTVESWFGRDR